MTRFLLSAFLVFVPSLTYANCSQTHASSCPEGKIWDAASKTCTIHSS